MGAGHLLPALLPELEQLVAPSNELLLEVGNERERVRGQDLVAAVDRTAGEPDVRHGDYLPDACRTAAATAGATAGSKTLGTM